MCFHMYYRLYVLVNNFIWNTTCDEGRRNDIRGEGGDDGDGIWVNVANK